jgi:hypothetical protein
VSAVPPTLPAPLRGIETGTFTHYSIAVRLVDIARRTLAENDLPEANEALLQALIADIPQAPIRSLQEPLASDAPLWDEYVQEHLGKNWLEAPWFFVEAYFYRRVLEAVGYVQSGPRQGLDPFLDQKNSGYTGSTGQVYALARLLNRSVEQDEGFSPSALATFLHTALWGNQADLSLWPSGEGDRPDHPDLEKANQFLLVDDTSRLVKHLSALPEQVGRVDFLNDNAGFELVTDFCLADYLLSSGRAAQVQFHLKSHPTFVSDTLPSDARSTVLKLKQEPDPDAARLGFRLAEHIQHGRLVLTQDDFWTSPLAGWEMPERLYQQLASSSLVIVKGDMHYRRCLGDRHWPFTASFQDILHYYPAPVVCLRTLKSEIVCGLSLQQVENLPGIDPNWLTNGRWGLLQYRG